MFVRLPHEWMNLEAFIAKAERAAEDRREECPKSSDSNRRYTFRDGSALVIENPRQRFHSAAVYTE